MACVRVEIVRKGFWKDAIDPLALQPIRRAITQLAITLQAFLGDHVLVKRPHEHQNFIPARS